MCHHICMVWNRWKDEARLESLYKRAKLVKGGMERILHLEHSLVNDLRLGSTVRAVWPLPSQLVL